MSYLALTLIGIAVVVAANAIVVIFCSANGNAVKNKLRRPSHPKVRLVVDNTKAA